MIPDINDAEKMARLGRLSALHKARKERAEKARDYAVWMLGHLDESDKWDIESLSDALTEIKALTAMIKEQ